MREGINERCGSRMREKESKRTREPCYTGGEERAREKEREHTGFDGKRSERQRAGIIVYSVGITMAGPGLQIY